jgi:ATP-dependent Zn protease
LNDMVKNILLWVVIAVVLMSVFNSFGPKVTPSAQMSYSQFLQEAKQGRIAQVRLMAAPFRAAPVAANALPPTARKPTTAP